MLGLKSIKNIGLKEHQIISLPGVPTCLGPARVSQSIAASLSFFLAFSVSLSLVLHAAVHVTDVEASSNHLDDCISNSIHKYNNNQPSVTKTDCYGYATCWWDKSYMWDQATVAWMGRMVTKITTSIIHISLTLKCTCLYEYKSLKKIPICFDFDRSTVL